MAKTNWKKCTGRGTHSTQTIHTDTYQIELHELLGVKERDCFGYISAVETDGNFVVVTVKKVLKHITDEE